MTAAEARFPTQVEEDRRERFNRHDYGFPYCGWLYWHSEGKKIRSREVLLDAPYADPVTGGMRPIIAPSRLRLRLEREERREERAKVEAFREKLRRERARQASLPHPMAEFLWPRPPGRNHHYWASSVGGMTEAPSEMVTSAMDPVTVQPFKARSEPVWEGVIPEVPEIDAKPVPETLMVNRTEYLGHINALMKEWQIKTEHQFNNHRHRLIKHALHRMGKL